jgi:hypothetical protein
MLSSLAERLRVAKLQKLLRPVQIPVTEGGGMGICRVAAMFIARPIVCVDYESKFPLQKEIKLLRTYLEYRMDDLRESYREKICKETYICDTCVSTIFRKFAPNAWKYRKSTWEYGPYMVPETPVPLETLINEHVVSLWPEGWKKFIMSRKDSCASHVQTVTRE